MLSDRFFWANQVNKLIAFFSVAVIGITLDQISKILVVKFLGVKELVIIPGFFSLLQAQNPGAAGSFLGDLPVNIRMSIFGVFTVVAIIIIVSMLIKLPKEDWFQASTLGLLIAGTIGNAIDRVDKQTVTDFLLFYTNHPSLKPFLIEHLGTNYYPTFNVADICLFCGIAIFLLYYAFKKDSDEEDDSEVISA